MIFMSQEAPNPSYLSETDILDLAPVERIMAKMVKSQHVQQFLVAMLNEVIVERAHQKLNFKPEALYEAAAASGFSLGQLQLLTRMVELGHVLEN
jgi:hypothetical protein